MLWLGDLDLDNSVMADLDLDNCVVAGRVGSAVAHQRFVVACGLKCVGPLPAGAAVVPEACQVSAEEGSLLQGAHVARRVLQVRVNLDLKPT